MLKKNLLSSSTLDSCNEYKMDFKSELEKKRTLSIEIIYLNLLPENV